MVSSKTIMVVEVIFLVSLSLILATIALVPRLFHSW